MSTPLVLVLVVLAVALVGFVAGRIYQTKKDERDDLNARDAWANEMEQRA